MNASSLAIMRKGSDRNRRKPWYWFRYRTRVCGALIATLVLLGTGVV
jgi:hypothetical protein